MTYFLVVLAAGLFIFTGFLLSWMGMRNYLLVNLVQFVVASAVLLVIHLFYVPMATVTGVAGASFGPPAIMLVLSLGAYGLDQFIRRRAHAGGNDRSQVPTPRL